MTWIYQSYQFQNSQMKQSLQLVVCHKTTSFLRQNTGDYVTSLGRIVPLPEKDLEIAPELLQCNPDISELEKPEPMVNAPKVNTLPCSINLRCLDQSDMQKVPATLPDRMENVSDNNVIATSKYNLRKRELVSNRLQSDRPQRESSKSVTYAEQTDENSQNSQIIGTIYPMDNPQIPDAKLEKIVGMSEPSAYRLGAQNYIEAKKRGEIPPPPKCTLCRNA